MNEKDEEELIERITALVMQCVVDISGELKGLDEAEKMLIYSRMEDIAVEEFTNTLRKEKMH